ncbi:ATP-binding protein [Streptomyces fumanus]|uniref:ATPase n=1 Tax=Streptomyces fumanus TaxID=67302 RepID=A0A919AJY0_9ACTN|nr:ATP-binding protein [Streptomyces fumanus]GHF11781.1 ATPase [Streptomyces fumanus]
MHLSTGQYGARSPAEFQVALPSSPACAGQARRIADTLMREWAVSPLLVGDVLLVVSELVTNAFLHSGTDLITVSVGIQNGVLRIGVRHHVTRHRPVLRRPRNDDEHGRGLLLVKAIADSREGAWGVSRDGTTTWCELSLAVSR